MVNLAVQYPGYTVTQLSWILAGGQVDAQGYCQPAAAFAMALEFFNAKRRGCEIARAVDEDTRRPNARLLYGRALNNPYEFGGHGVYPLGGGVAVPVSITAPAPQVEVKRADMPAELMALLD